MYELGWWFIFSFFFELLCIQISILTFEIYRLMMRFFGCMEVNKKWLLSKFYHLYKYHQENWYISFLCRLYYCITFPLNITHFLSNYILFRLKSKVFWKFEL